MTNPLLDINARPDFSRIDISHFVPAIETLLSENRLLVENLCADGESTWDGFALPLEEGLDRLSQAWAVVSLFNSVLNSDEMRAIFKELVPKVTAFYTEFGQNKALFDAIAAIEASDGFEQLDSAKIKAIDNSVRDFHLSGVDLPEDKKQRFGELKSRLSELQTQFSENVLDSTEGWYKHCTDVSELKGLPEDVIKMAQKNAEKKELEGYVLTLDIPCYFPVMSHCENQQVRKEMYDAYMTRASDQGPNAGKWDNTPLIDEILALRTELADLLSFNNYAERSLATKMASSTDEVVNFLNDLADKSVAEAKSEFADLERFAAEELGMHDIEFWDIAFCAERLREQKFNISQEELKPYFPDDKVMQGMFECAKRLYGIDIAHQADVPTYHPDVKYFSLSRSGQEIAGFFLDTYAREGKRGGAWMADCMVRRTKEDGSLQLPVAYLCCNFTPPMDGKPSLLRHEEVTTLFHEFGHGLHHMLTKIDVADVSGINGVAWDAVELPSQFMENWCWHEESLALISGHHETGEPLPAELKDKLLAAKNFQSAMYMVRQLEFSLFDFILHRDFVAGETNVQEVLRNVRDKVAIKVAPAHTRFSHSFSHIFAGGYAAGYYSYKWAEVLAADAFSRFEEEGIFNSETGQDFLNCILEQGGADDAMTLFESFRGRKPSVEPLLRSAGIGA